jgi:hypothetical protein
VINFKLSCTGVKFYIISPATDEIKNRIKGLQIKRFNDSVAVDCRELRKQLNKQVNARFVCYSS